MGPGNIVLASKNLSTIHVDLGLRGENIDEFLAIGNFLNCSYFHFLGMNQKSVEPKDLFKYHVSSYYLKNVGDRIGS